MSADAPAVLLVEDDPSLREVVSLLLERAGLGVTAVGDGLAAIGVMGARNFDLVLLDVMLPLADGFEVCRTIRSYSQVPIVMLTAKDDTADVVRGLELGADDYITKPFETEEMLARVRVALRRQVADRGEPVLHLGPLTIDIPACQVRRDDEVVELSATEFRLLVELARRPGEALSRSTLLQLVWGYDYLGDSRLVDMAVMRLRDKLEDRADAPSFIATVRGVGYRFERD